MKSRPARRGVTFLAFLRTVCIEIHRSIEKCMVHYESEDRRGGMSGPRREITETGDDLRDSCSDDRSTCVRLPSASRGESGDPSGGFPRGTYPVPRRIADYGTLGSPPPRRPDNLDHVTRKFHWRSGNAPVTSGSVACTRCAKSLRFDGAPSRGGTLRARREFEPEDPLQDSRVFRRCERREEAPDCCQLCGRLARTEKHATYLYPLGLRHFRLFFCCFDTCTRCDGCSRMTLSLASPAGTCVPRHSPKKKKTSKTAQQEPDRHGAKATRSDRRRESERDQKEEEIRMSRGRMGGKKTEEGRERKGEEEGERGTREGGK